MSTTFKKFRSDNIVKTKYTAHKQYSINITEYSGSQQGYEKYQLFAYDSQYVSAFTHDHDSGRNIRHDEFLVGTVAGTTYTEMQTTNNFYKRSLHDSLAHMYYNGSHAINVNLDNSFCVEPTRNEYRELNGFAQILGIPQQLFGDKLLENDILFDKDNPSLKILSGTIELHEDGFGNLYDTKAANLSNPYTIYSTTTSSLVGYWGFNELYPYHTPHVSGHCPSFFTQIKDGSRYQTNTIGNSVFIHSASKHGAGAMLTGQRGNIYDPNKYSFFRAEKHDKLDFRRDEDFALSLWAKLPPSQSDTTGLFNYIVTSGQGDHTDLNSPSGHWSSNFPFDLVMYNQTAGVREQANLTFRQQAYSTRGVKGRAAKQLLRVTNNCYESASAHSASIAFSFSAYGGGNIPAIGSSSFIIGHDESNVLTIHVTASTKLADSHDKNTDHHMYVPTTTGVFADMITVINHFNNAATQSKYSKEIGMIEAFTKSATVANYSNICFGYKGQLHYQNDSVEGTNFDRHAGAKFVFRAGPSASVFRTFAGGWDPAANLDSIRVESNTGSINQMDNPNHPHHRVYSHAGVACTRTGYAKILRQPSESSAILVKDVFGTSHTFTITSASNAVYPNISVHGNAPDGAPITSSISRFQNFICSKINSGMDFGQTSSASPRILMVSASSIVPARKQTGLFDGEIVISSSVVGNFDYMGTTTAGPGHNNMQIIPTAGNAFNNYATANTPAPNDTDASNGFNQAGPALPTMYTSSFFILSCRSTHSYAPSENVDPDSQERHVFYWKSGSSPSPDLGTYATNSTTIIDLGSAYHFPGTTAHISGAFDYWNIASRSYCAIEAHPSFSVDIKTSLFEFTGTNYIGGGDGTGIGLLKSGFDDNAPNLVKVAHEHTTLHRSSSTEHGGYRSPFPKLPTSPNTSNSTIELIVTAVNHGLTPAAQSGSVTGPLFTSDFNDASLIAANHATLPTFSLSDSEGTVGRPGQILARRNDGHNLYQVSSSELFVDNQRHFHHILFQKTGSNLELYVNNNLQHSLKATDMGDTKNKDNIYFGVATRMTWSGEYEREVDGLYRINPGTGNPVRKMNREFMRPLSGALDEINIFDKALNPEQRQLIHNCPNGTPFVGNVMHEHGIVTITHPSSSYTDMIRNCTASFKNTHVITENSYTAEIKRGEFNFTSNPTILDRSAEGLREAKIASFVADTDWDPYITTIGLYDGAARLLAVGKLSRPLRKDEGYDTTIEVRFDT